MMLPVLLLSAAVTLAAEPAEESPQADGPTILLVVGHGGEPEFGEQFQAWAERWKQAAEQAQATLHTVGLEQDEKAAGSESESAENDREKLQALLAKVDQQSDHALWIVLIGHGTFDRREAKFNLTGRDVTATELVEWLKPLDQPIAVIGCYSSSAPLINRLSGENRVVATATKSGYELNYSRFGDYFSKAIADPAADLDKDNQVSLLEAFLSASKQVEEFYAREGRLATEQALLDDNGDSLGTPAAFFRGIRAVKQAKDGAALDGLRAAQFHLIASEAERNMPADVRRRRDELELTLAQLRGQKSMLAEDEYLGQIEPLLVELAELYEGLEQEKEEPASEAEKPVEDAPDEQDEAKPAAE